MRSSSRRFSPSSWTSAVLLTSAVAACGGTFVPGEGDGDSGPGDDGSASGGNDGVGGAATGGAGTGGAGTGGLSPGDGGAGCCLAVAVCDGFDKQIDSPADCPLDIDCYSKSVCCSTIWCMPEQPLCDGIATCLSDETQVDACPTDATCTVRSHCDSVVVCQLNEGVCDPQREYARHYVADSPESCAVTDYDCPAHTSSFSSDCGCGCEQPASCPAFVDCAPTVGDDDPDPLCADTEECPYTVRAQ